MRELLKTLTSTLEFLSVPPQAPCCAREIHWASFR